MPPVDEYRELSTITTFPNYSGTFPVIEGIGGKGLTNPWI